MRLASDPAKLHRQFAFFEADAGMRQSARHCATIAEIPWFGDFAVAHSGAFAIAHSGVYARLSLLAELLGSHP
jgi:hypothetical protein